MDNISRRQFFARMRQPGCARLPAGRSEDANAAALAGLPHFKPTAKRVIYLFQSGGPSQMDCSTTSPARPTCRHGPSGIGPNGSAAHDDVVRSVEVPGCALEIQIRAARKIGSMGQRVAATYSQDCGPADVREVLPHRSDQSRSCRHLHSRRDRRSPAGPAWDPGSPTASVRKRKTCRHSWS